MAACEAAGEAARMALGVALAAPGSIAVGAAHAASPSASLAPRAAALSFVRAPVLLLSMSPSLAETSSLVPPPAAPASFDRRSSHCVRARSRRAGRLSGEHRVGECAACGERACCGWRMCGGLHTLDGWKVASCFAPGRGVNGMRDCSTGSFDASPKMVRCEATPAEPAAAADGGAAGWAGVPRTIRGRCRP
jgi:hypothetical protein